MSSVIEEQQKLFSLIKNEICNNKISHAYLIETNDYNNVQAVVKEFVKLLLCNNRYIEGQNCYCDICTLIDNNNYPDIEYIDADGSFIKKEQLMKIQKDFRNKSAYNNKQIYIINDATKLNSSSANTILKFLEEPGEGIIAILIANNRYKVIDTIVSRCQVISLENVKTEYFSDEIKQLAVDIFSQDRGYLVFNNLLERIPTRDCCYENLKEIERMLFSYICNDENKFLNLDNTQLVSLISRIENTIKKMEYNVNYKLVLDDLLINIWEVYNENS